MKYTYLAQVEYDESIPKEALERMKEDLRYKVLSENGVNTERLRSFDYGLSLVEARLKGIIFQLEHGDGKETLISAFLDGNVYRKELLKQKSLVESILSEFNLYRRSLLSMAEKDQKKQSLPEKEEGV